MRVGGWGIAGLMAGMVMTSGCAVALVGAGAAAGYAISKDSVSNSFDLPQDTVFREAAATVKDLGFITLEDEKRGLLKGEVGGVNVKITVKPLTKRTVRLKVQARNDLLMPQIEVAHEVYNKIIERLP